MDVAHGINGEQARLWNGPAGCAWVEAQEALDRMFKPFEAVLVEAISAASAARVLDVGCGTGAITLAAARLLEAKGHCVGIDISAPMVAVARARAERDGTPARFIRADAQTHSFEPASFDMIVSRFGVMFFDDPAEAFANLRQAARDGAELRFAAWRSAAENPFMTTAERAAAPLLPSLPARRPDASGQFAFADRRCVYSILEESGWVDIDIRPIDVACAIPETELVRYVGRLGPVGLALQEADDRLRTQVIETVRAAFDPYVRGAEARFAAACWMVGARAPSASARPKEAADA
jgi:SAM-dependent methyltransferase